MQKSTVDSFYYSGKKTRTCSICEKVFETYNVRQKYCSFKCSRAAREQNMTARRSKYEQQNILKFGIREDTPAQISFTCKNCGKKFSRYRSQVQKRGAGYCSTSCRVNGSKKAVPTDKQLVDLWAKVVKLKDGGKCVYCGREQSLNSHHIFSRSNRSTRYELNNGITLCAFHHMLSSAFSAHKTPVEFVEWIKERRGETWYQALRFQARSIKKYTKDELCAMRDNFKLEIKNYS